MKKVITWLKNIRPVKILTVFLAATFLLMTQACNRPGIAQQPPQPNAQPPNAQQYNPTKSYELNAPEGGMNNFSDVDPRAKAAERAANARAAELAKNARRNVEHKGIDSSEQYVRNYQEGTPLDERIKRLGEDVGSSAEELGKGVTKGTQRGVENLQKNTGRAAEDLSKSVKRGAEDTTSNLQRQAEDTADAVKRTMREVDLD
ncbi:hypothetical protein [Nodularia spumigena]|uniref:hypothetical protein n=1 Tax=Nodularia spumigena TaxID=70799 RepID=UPI00232FBAAC|nr:hypothetical protein [Nodularia spumigena]MDB9316604.1 hypothetical protein [Nodularia spumigena CS-590/01A]MDB9320849.1 hypothetical protein [Nodularia spumigena CS-591/07A]MDB9328537.1 hypothetical protein [Nodularia spumigena CS-590/02]MDB9330380.1 hypothetical protein [Nodularia spumigena CS-591/04]MDB9336263.1 hypothetical protein [Nodularia spumigena CS-590/01]